MTQVQTGYAEFNNTRTYYELGGNPNGKTLVFLAAAVADSGMYATQFAAFARDYRVLRYDLRGTGKTEAPIPSETPFSFVDDLRQLLAHLHIDRVALIGTSNGGQVALDYALTYPEQVMALVLASASLGGYEMQGEPPALVFEIIQAMQAGDLEKAADLGLQMHLAGLDRKLDAIAEPTRQKTRAMMLQALQRTGSGLGEPQEIDPPAAQRLKEVQAPTLVIISEHDHPAVQAMDQLIAEGIPNAEAIKLNAGHLASIEIPDEFTNDVKVFLDRVLK